MRTFSTSEREKRFKTPSLWHFWLGNVLRATTVYTCSTSEHQKVVRTRQFFALLTWKRASHHNGVHFLNISPSKNGPNMVWFVHFDLAMCFAPQWPPLFQHLTFEKWSKHGVLCTFDLAMCFAPERRAIFHLSSGELAPHPPPLASLLSDHPEPQIIGNTVNRDFPTFSRTCIFFLLTLSLLCSSHFSLLTLPTSAFPFVHIVGSLTSRLPSMMYWAILGKLDDHPNADGHGILELAPWLRSSGFDNGIKKSTW